MVFFCGHQGSSQSDPYTITGFGSLNSPPVISYRKGGALPIWSPAQSGGYVKCVAHGFTCRLTCGLTHVGYVQTALTVL